VHTSVLLSEAVDYLKCEKKKLILDCTVGAAGHTKEILKRLPLDGRVLGIDADKTILKIAEENLKSFNEKRFSLYNQNFRDFDKVLNKLKIDSVDGMLFDLGVSSFQLNDEKRGFSFLGNGPCDMRMNTDAGKPLWQILTSLSERDLGEIIRDLGEERSWRKIAKAVISEQRRGPIKDSGKLADLIRAAANYRPGTRIDPATRTFQALRIFVNDELGALKEVLLKTGSFLSKDARLVVISFHSLEDRIVKHTFKDMAKEGILNIITKKPVRPGEDECMTNPRSRSAKLRVAERI